MPDYGQSQSFEVPKPQDKLSEDLIRQDYSIRVSDNQTFVVPNAFGGLDLPLSKTLKPDYSKALKMGVGVRVWLAFLFQVSYCPCSLAPPTPIPIPIPTNDSAGRNQKIV